MSFVPKYKHIAEVLKKQIELGEIPQDSSMPSEYELSEAFKVSRTTVIHALDELRRQNIIYTLHGSGSYVCENINLKNNPNFSNFIFVLLPFSGYERASRTDEAIILKSLEIHLSKSGFFPIVHYCDDDCESFYNSFSKLQSFPHEGIIIYPPQDPDTLLVKHPEVEKMLMSKPTVLFDQSFGDLDIPYVYPNYSKGCSAALQHLIDCGYTKLYFMTSASINHNSSIRSRYEGFEKTLKKNHIKQAGTYIYVQAIDERMEVNEDIKRYMDIIRRTVEQNPDERIGIICYCDYMARKVYNACLELGYSVPDRIGIVGFGNMDLSLSENVKLTSVDPEYQKGCKAAVKLLTTLIYNNKAEASFKYDIKLSIKDTTEKL